ncbi:hypothetical protein CsatA_003045 [Cannabis sativa]
MSFIMDDDQLHNSEDMESDYSDTNTNLNKPRVISEKLTYFPDKIIGQGSYGSIVFEGLFDGSSVAVKRLQLEYYKIVGKEIKALEKSKNQHPNIVRYYGVEKDSNFFYIALERGVCDLDVFMRLCSSRHDPNNVSPSELLLRNSLFGDHRRVPSIKFLCRPTHFLVKLMRDIVKGVEYLHSLKIMHRDLKPSNILIFKEEEEDESGISICAKICDMGISKPLPYNRSSITNTSYGTKGWQPPERINIHDQTNKISTAVDMFSLGCVLSFCITEGRSHPFDTRDGRDRNSNIADDKKDLKFLSYFGEAEDLISKLISKDPKSRPTAAEVLVHPMLWNSNVRNSFLYDISNRLVKLGRNSEFSKALERIAIFDDLDRKILLIPIITYSYEFSKTLKTMGGTLQSYDLRSKRLLLTIDESKNISQEQLENNLANYGYDHFREWNFIDLLQSLGTLTHINIEGNIIEFDGQHLDGYIAPRFPKVFMEVYKVILNHYKEEEEFKSYFEEGMHA